MNKTDNEVFVLVAAAVIAMPIIWIFTA